MATLNISVGRVRVTRVVSPAEAGYIRHMNAQMKVVTENLQKVIRKVKGTTAEAIVFALKPIFDLSQELVPELTGKLKRSGFIRVDKESRSGHIRAQIGYGKGGVPSYAVFVHEMTNIRHAKGKQAKFLSTAVDQKLHVFTSRLIAYMQQNSGLKGKGALK